MTTNKTYYLVFQIGGLKWNPEDFFAGIPPQICSVRLPSHLWSDNERMEYSHRYCVHEAERRKMVITDMRLSHIPVGTLEPNLWEEYYHC